MRLRETIEVMNKSMRLLNGIALEISNRICYRATAL